MILVSLALGAPVQGIGVWVAVHREAGSVFDLAVDGAAGQCTVQGPSRLRCPAKGPVTVRWAGDPGFVIDGPTVLEPGTEATLFVLAGPGRQAAVLESLEQPDVDVVRDTFVRTGDRVVPPIGRNLFDRQLDLIRHPDPAVRLQAVRGLMPYVRHTASDPFPAGSPSLLPVGVLTRITRDPDRRVRRESLRLIRELLPEDPRFEEGWAAVRALLDHPDRTTRSLAISVDLANVVTTGGDIEQAWSGALARVPQEGGPGRSAVVALIGMVDSVDHDQIDARSALVSILEHHPEKAWRFWWVWREGIPLEPVLLRILLRRTVSVEVALFRHWAERDPDALAEVVREWEPAPPHSDRFRLLKSALTGQVEHAGLREVLELGDSLSAVQPAGEGG